MRSAHQTDIPSWAATNPYTKMQQPNGNAAAAVCPFLLAWFPLASSLVRCCCPSLCLRPVGAEPPLDMVWGPLRFLRMAREFPLRGPGLAAEFASLKSEEVDTMTCPICWWVYQTTDSPNVFPCASGRLHTSWPWSLWLERRLAIGYRLASEEIISFPVPRRMTKPTWRFIFPSTKMWLSKIARCRNEVEINSHSVFERLPMSPLNWQWRYMGS